MSETVIKIDNLKKQYRLGTIGGGTLTAEIQSWWAKKRGKEDPNVKIGANKASAGDVFWALDGINLEVKKGEALGIIGANGAGKSTLLKILSRVTAPTNGTICMNGRIASMLEVGTGFHAELTGRENIYMNGAILGMTKSEIDAKMDDIIEFSECGQFIDTPVKRYSSGMYVKLAFAVAAHLDAEIMIMDEVLAVGDVKFQQKCLGKMGDASSHEGKTVLYVSHNMSTIRQLCTRCIVLDKGKIVYDGDVEEAIDYYLGRQSVSLVKNYDFSNAKRPTLDHGRNLFVHTFSFENVEKPSYRNGDTMKFSFEYTSKENGKEVAVYFTVLTDEGTPVGTTVSKSLGFTEANIRVKKNLEFDVTSFIPGIYHFYFDVCYTNEYGRLNSCDHPLEPVFFEVVDDGNINMENWDKRAWGRVSLPELRLVK